MSTWMVLTRRLESDNIYSFQKLLDYITFKIIWIMYNNCSIIWKLIKILIKMFI